MTEPRDHFVYRVFDADGQALYVGCTAHPNDRYKSHLRGDDGRHGWFGPFAHRWAVTGPLPRSKARGIEMQAIKDLDPLFNTFKTGVPSSVRRRRVKAYFASQGMEYPLPWWVDQRDPELRRIAAA